jgi:hypothetical protein
LIPSVLAVMVTDPPATAVTSPMVLTVATFGWDDDQVIVLPEIELPFASATLAVSCIVSPSEIRAAEGVTATVEISCATVTDAVAEVEPEVTLIIAEPFPTAVTRPVDKTLATDDAEDAQATDAPLMVAPF